MDFSNRGFQRNNDVKPAGSTPATSPSGSSAPFGDEPKPATPKTVGVSVKHNKPLLILGILLSVSLLVLTVVTIIGIGTRSSEKSYVDTDVYQAVFIDGSQLPYFGKITEMNSSYLTLENIFYLNVTTGQVQPGDSNAANQQVSLVKLGCSELHGPYDTMVINRDKVQFWENLKPKGKVSTAITKWYDDGGKCETTTSESTTTDETTNNDNTTTDETNTNDTNNTNDTTDTNP